MGFVLLFFFISFIYFFFFSGCLVDYRVTCLETMTKCQTRSLAQLVMSMTFGKRLTCALENCTHVKHCQQPVAMLICFITHFCITHSLFW